MSSSVEIARNITIALLQRMGETPYGHLLTKSEELGKAAGKIYDEVYKVVKASM